MFAVKDKGTFSRRVVFFCGGIGVTVSIWHSAQAIAVVQIGCLREACSLPLVYCTFYMKAISVPFALLSDGGIPQ